MEIYLGAPSASKGERLSLAGAALLSVKLLAAHGDSHSTTDFTDNTDALIAVSLTFVVSVESVV